jgi:hypothetical protein
MKPVDEFLRSVRRAFRPEDDGGGTGWVWALAAVGLLAALLVLRRLRLQRRTRRSAAAAFAKVMSEHNIGAADEQLIRRMAARAGVEPTRVATQPELFEVATAAVLAAVPAPAVDGADEGPFAQVGRLRLGLGFHVVPHHVPLVTTRQLVSGQRVEMGAVPGEVAEVNEAWFTVNAMAGGAFVTGAVGQKVRVAFTRGSEARYTAQCTVAAAEPLRAPRRLTLRHDEKLERVQLRSAVRVPARGAVELRSRTAAAIGAASGDPGAARGELVDLSLGGLALSTETLLPVGASLYATFEWEGAEYRDLPASVIACAPRPRGLHLARLEFHGLPAGEEDRLAAAIARRSAHGPEGEATE